MRFEPVVRHRRQTLLRQYLRIHPRKANPAPKRFARFHAARSAGRCQSPLQAYGRPPAFCLGVDAANRILQRDMPKVYGGKSLVLAECLGAIAECAHADALSREKSLARWHLGAGKG
jgi:hypothetical protein